MKKRLLIVGGHGSGEITMSIFEDINVITNEWDIAGYLTDIREPGQKLGKHIVDLTRFRLLLHPESTSIP